LPSPDPLVKMSLFHLEGDTDVAMTASTTIDADVYQCAAFDLTRMSRNALKEHYKSGGLERSLTKINEHDYVYVFGRDYHIPGAQPRDFVMRVIWKRVNESTLVIASESFVDLENHPSRDGVVRASTTVLTELKMLDAVGEVPQTRLTYTQQVNLGGGECEKSARTPLPPSPPLVLTLSLCSHP
jgi:hypothetical protein